MKDDLEYKELGLSFIEGVRLCNQTFQRNVYNEIKRWQDVLGFEPTVVFDIGANVGTYAITLAAMYERARVFAFEPVPQTYAELVQNVHLSKMPDRIFPNNNGIWSDEAWLEIGIPLEHATDPGAYSVKHPDGLNVVEGQFVSLDDAVATCGSKPDFMKIDAEGAEYEILSAATSSLDDLRGLVVEMNEDPRFECQRVRDVLQDLGFIDVTIYGSALRSAYNTIWTRS